MSNRITKIKNKDGVIEIHHEDKFSKTEKETIFRCTEPAHPDLSLAFNALVRDVRDILMGWCPPGMEVTGVSFSLAEELDIEGAVMTFKVPLETSNAPFCGNTPHLPFDQYSDGGNQPVMPEEAIERLNKLREEATAYMEGKKRAQSELALSVGKV